MLCIILTNKKRRSAFADRLMDRNSRFLSKRLLIDLLFTQKTFVSIKARKWKVVNKNGATGIFLGPK